MAANGTNKSFSWGGITGQPLSTATPTERELSLQAGLVEELRAQNNFASQQDINVRKQALGRLFKVVQEFIRAVGTKKGLSKSALDSAGGKLFTFGSYRLGVFGPGSDIDTLLVAPKHVSRDDFFDIFPNLLRKMLGEFLKDLNPIPDAHTPIMKLKLGEVDIDLLFVSLKTSSIPDNMEITNEEHLRGLDETDIRSINGARVSDELLSLVPEPKAFRYTLRVVKLWAQRRGVYGNVIGFPGGIAWAICVARICQFYPCATGATIVAKFFNLMMKWSWPQPVMLKPHQGQGPLQVRAWNPQIYPADKGHLMPIITPAYPGMCTTHNVTQSTLTIIKRELKRASDIANDIFDNKKPWSALFEKHTFFTKDYRHYLSINCGSRTKELQPLWSGFVLSRVRRLISLIELTAKGVNLPHPFVKGFDRIHVCLQDDFPAVLMGETKFQVKSVPEVVPEGQSVFYTTTYYVGLELAVGEHSGPLDLSTAVQEWDSQNTQWPQYVHGDNFLRVAHTRNYDLPPDVFEPGEIRPVKKGKKKPMSLAKTAMLNGANVNERAGQKRKSSDDPEEGDAKRQRPEAAAQAEVQQNGITTPGD